MNSPSPCRRSRTSFSPAARPEPRRSTWPGRSAAVRELRVVALSRQEAVGPHTIAYLNRLSDALFVMARFENLRRGVPDILWDSRA